MNYIFKYSLRKILDIPFGSFRFVRTKKGRKGRKPRASRCSDRADTLIAELPG
jgi:hypothetical protein